MKQNKMNGKKIIALLVLTLGMVPLVRSQHIDEAKDLIESERYNSAETVLEKNLGTSEPEPELSYLLVKIYLEQEKTDDAAKYVNRYLQSGISGDMAPLERIANARYLLNSGNKSAANEIFAAVLADRKNQKNPALLFAMAEVAIEEEAGDAKAALTWLDMAAKRDKQDPAIDIARGLAYRKLNDASNAFLAFQEAIKKDPGNARAHYLMGKIFTAQKNPDIYMQHFLKAYGIDSTYAPVLEELYNHYYFRDVRIAKKYLEKYIVNTDYSLQNDYYLTDMEYLVGDYQNAIRSAGTIISKEQEKVQPRLYKLIAYSYAKSGDSAKALLYINEYLKKEEPIKTIAADFQFVAQLTERMEGQEEAAISYYTIAADMDTVTANKAGYAAAIAELYKKKDDDAKQAIWLGKVYEWKEKTNNVDLFNWGLAHYMAKDYRMTDSVFSLYTGRYPNDIYGYYWRAQSNAAIDTSMADSLAVPWYHKVVEIGEQNKEANKKMLLKAYGYLGGFEANITKDYSKSLEWFEKYNALEENADVSKYIEMLHKWIAGKK
jgi:TolA-binding protein